MFKEKEESLFKLEYMNNYDYLNNIIDDNYLEIGKNGYFIQTSKNDYYFWEKYLESVIKKLSKLSEEKEFIYADFHIHSNYSADSSQTLDDIIKKSNQMGLDIISITDHDSLGVYDELYEYIVTNKIYKIPIIIPGIEFTVLNKEYGAQFHVLQLMVNPKSKEIIKDVKFQQEKAWFRAKKQIKRFKKNKKIFSLLKGKKINVSYFEYKKYIKNSNYYFPEYKSIMEYLFEKFKFINVSNWDLLYYLKKWNSTDLCYNRKKIKYDEYNKLEREYINKENSDIDFRFFHRLLAIRDADDDFYPNYKVMGDLSVNYYNQLNLHKLNNKNITFIAHPSENKLHLIDDIIKKYKIYGIEHNKRCKYKDCSNLYKKIKKYNMLKIVGSDSHNYYNDLYNDMDFYKYTRAELKNFIINVKKYIDKN